MVEVVVEEVAVEVVVAVAARHLHVGSYSSEKAGCASFGGAGHGWCGTAARAREAASQSVARAARRRRRSFGVAGCLKLLQVANSEEELGVIQAMSTEETSSSAQEEPHQIDA